MASLITATGMNSHQPIKDKLYDAMVIPWKCDCCKVCWLYVDTKRKGTCVHGGPYKGCVIVTQDPPPQAGEDA